MRRVTRCRQYRSLTKADDHLKLSGSSRCVRDVQKRVQDLDDRVYALEARFLGERLEDGKVYVRRRYPDK